MPRDTTHGFLVISASLLCLTAACASESQQAPTASVRDSAGVRIVENSMPLLAEDACWTVGPEATVTIGEVDGSPEYILVSPWAARLSDGRIAILDRGARELRLFSPEGLHLSSAGREGEGPGEFRGSNSVHVVAGDTMVIWDGGLRRLSLFDPTGGFVRSISIQEAEPIQLSLGVLDLQTLLGSRLIESSDSAGLYISRNEVLVISSDGVAKVAVDTTHEPRYATDRLSTYLPFAPSPFHAAGAGRAYLTHGAPFEVFVYGTDGSLLEIIRRDWSDDAVTEADIEQYLEWTLSFGNEDRQRQWLPVREEAARLSSTKPAISWLVPDRVGNLWVARWNGYGPQRLKKYDVFSRDGRWLCGLEVPHELQMITDIGEDYVLGLVIDDLDVQRIGMYPLRK